MGLASVLYLVITAVVTVVSYRGPGPRWVARVLPPPAAARLAWKIGIATVLHCLV